MRIRILLVRDRHAAQETREIEFGQSIDDVLSGSFRVNVSVDTTKNACTVNIERPPVRVEAAEAEHAPPFRGRSLGITQHERLRFHRCGKLCVLRWRIQADIKNLDIELGKLFGTVTQRGKFSRSTRSEGFREPGDDDAFLASTFADVVREPMLSFGNRSFACGNANEKEIRSRLSDLGRCGPSWFRRCEKQYERQ